jgi:hypothetical protein
MDLRSGRKVRWFSFPRSLNRVRGRPPCSTSVRWEGDELREGQERPEQDQAFPRRDRTLIMLMPILEDSS